MKHICRLLVVIAVLSTTLRSDPPKSLPLPPEIMAYIAHLSDASAREAMSHTSRQFRHAAIQSAKQQSESFETFIWLIEHNDSEAVADVEEILFEMLRVEQLLKGGADTNSDPARRWERELDVLKPLMNKIGRAMVRNDRVHYVYLDVCQRATARFELFLQDGSQVKLSERALNVISRYAEINQAGFELFTYYTRNDNQMFEAALCYVIRQQNNSPSFMPLDDLHTSSALDVLQNLVAAWYQPGIDYASKFLATYVNGVETLQLCSQNVRFLAEGLVERGYAHHAALILALAGVRSDNEFIVGASLNLFMKLLQDLSKQHGGAIMADNPVLVEAVSASRLCGTPAHPCRGRARGLLALVLQYCPAQQFISEGMSVLKDNMHIEQWKEGLMGLLMIAGALGLNPTRDSDVLAFVHSCFQSIIPRLPSSKLKAVIDILRHVFIWAAGVLDEDANLLFQRSMSSTDELLHQHALQFQQELSENGIEVGGVPEALCAQLAG